MQDTPFKLKVTVTDGNGEVLEMETFTVYETSIGRASQKLIDTLEMKYDYEVDY